jgi:hypothetical protein
MNYAGPGFYCQEAFIYGSRSGDHVKYDQYVLRIPDTWLFYIYMKPVVNLAAVEIGELLHNVYCPGAKCDPGVNNVIFPYSLTVPAVFAAHGAMDANGVAVVKAFRYMMAQCEPLPCYYFLYNNSMYDRYPALDTVTG